MNNYVKAYKTDFGWALEQLNAGRKVVRTSWNNKDTFLFMISGNNWDFECDIEGVDEFETSPFICMKTADNKLVPWSVSQSDVVADDWDIVLDKDTGIKLYSTYCYNLMNGGVMSFGNPIMSNVTLDELMSSGLFSCPVGEQWYVAELEVGRYTIAGSLLIKRVA